MKSTQHISNITGCPICDSQTFTRVTIRFDSSHIVKCSNCGHVYLNPPLTNDRLTAMYSKYHVSENEESYMKTVDSWFNDPKGPYQYTLDTIERVLGLQGRRVLDIGCGPGRFLYECHKRGAHVIGIDSSVQAASLAKKYFGLKLIPKSFEEAIKGGDLPPSGFDIISMFEIIEHVQKPAEFLSALQQLLIPGGLLFLSTPNFYLFYLMGKAAPAVNQCPEHIHFFEPISLDALLKRCGFEIVKITTINPLTYGDRKKGAFAHISIVRKIWQKIRHIAPVYFIKNIIFKILDTQKQTADIRSWNGTSLLGIAHRATG